LAESYVRRILRKDNLRGGACHLAEHPGALSLRLGLSWRVRLLGRRRWVCCGASGTSLRLGRRYVWASWSCGRARGRAACWCGGTATLTRHGEMLLRIESVDCECLIGAGVIGRKWKKGC